MKTSNLIGLAALTPAVVLAQEPGGDRFDPAELDWSQQSIRVTASENAYFRVTTVDDRCIINYFEDDTFVFGLSDDGTGDNNFIITPPEGWASGADAVPVTIVSRKAYEEDENQDFALRTTVLERESRAGGDQLLRSRNASWNHGDLYDSIGLVLIHNVAEGEERLPTTEYWFGVESSTNTALLYNGCLIWKETQAQAATEQ